MEKYLLFFLNLVLVSIYGYIEYNMGKKKGREEAYDECLEELEKLKKFVEKETNLIARAPVLYDLLNSLLNEKVYNLDKQTRENIEYELKKARGE